MGRIVIVAEKPSVGRSIAKVIGCRDQEEGSLSNSRYIVTWAVGHLVTLQEPDEMDPEKYKTWKMDALPILPDTIPLKVIRETSSQFKIVSKLINDKDTDSLVCATDAGREGELIFRYIYIQAKCKKPFKRLWISSLTDEAIRDGMNHLEPGSNYDALYRSARARSEADWLVGMNASRAFTLRYNTLLSVGRVQTPTLAFLVKRLDQITNFVPQKYATVTADFGDYKGIMFSESLNPDTHIEKLEQAEKLVSIIKGKPGTVISVEVAKKKSQPPQLYDLTTLQRDANKHFGFTAEKTLQLAQALYENHKALTYPRTDSRYLPPDMVPVVRDTMKALPDVYQKYVDKALPTEKTLSNKRIVDETKVSDHHAILPTPKKVDMEQMSADERRLYDLVTRRMIAAFYPVCEYESTKIITNVGRFNFRTTGTTILAPGWREIAPAEGKENDKEKAEKDDEEDQLLPVVKKGDIKTVRDAKAEEKQTKPPSHYTDASLLLAMETAGKDSEDEEIVQQMKGHGIGTPATRAAIIERIIKLKYAKRDGKQIIATDKGCALIQIAPDEITSAETTGRWEKALDKIADKQQDPQKFRESICRFSSWLVEYAKTNDKTFNASAFKDTSRKEFHTQQIDDLLCPVCQKGKVTETDLGFSCTEWKTCGFTIWKETFRKKYGFDITLSMVKDLLSEKKEASIPVGTVYCDTNFGYLSIYVKKNGEKAVDSITSVRSWESHCPHCKKTSIKEYVWGYSCGAKCGFTLFKNAFEKAGGPPLISRSMFEDLITEGETEGIWLGTPEKHGVITLEEDSVCWYKTSDTENTEPEAEEKTIKNYTKKSPKRKRRTTRKTKN